MILSFSGGCLFQSCISEQTGQVVVSVFFPLTVGDEKCIQI